MVVVVEKVVVSCGCKGREREVRSEREGGIHHSPREKRTPNCTAWGERERGNYTAPRKRETPNCILASWPQGLMAQESRPTPHWELLITKGNRKRHEGRED